MCPLDHPLTGGDLGLPKVENGNAVGVGEVIRGAEGFGFVVALPAQMMPDNPLAGPAERLSVAERQTWLKLPVIRLPARLEEVCSSYIRSASRRHAARPSFGPPPAYNSQLVSGSCDRAWP
jgi:hypothetical protein